MKVSAIIPCYNHARYVGRAIESVLSQSYPNLELLVVDDASQDDSFSTIDSYHDNRIRKLRRERNGGVSQAINDGIRSSTGDAICILSADDTWPLDNFAKQVAYLETNPNMMVVSGLARWLDDQGKDISEKFSGWLLSENCTQAQWLQRLFRSNRLGMSTAMFRRRIVDQVGPHDTRLSMFGDYDWWVRILFSTGEIHVLPEIMLNISISADNSNMSTPTLSNYSVSVWQLSKVLQHYLRLSFDGFESVFQKKVLDRSATSVARELAFIAAEIGSPGHRLFAAEALFSDPFTRDNADACRYYHSALRELDPLNIQRLWLK